MRTFLKQAERIGFAVRRRGGLLMLIPALLLCAWLMTGNAYAADSTYLFEVTTGVRTAKGDEEKINVFIITYTTESSNGESFSKFLFPAKDGWNKTYEMLTAVNTDQKKLDDTINSTYGYIGTELGSGKSRFQSYSTDQYLFTTREPIKEVKRVQFFAADSGSWNCRAMRIFRVDELGGLYRWNTASNDCYIDFKGDLIAEGTMSKDINIAWTSDKLLYTKDENGDNGVDITLKTSGFNDAYAHHERQDHTKKTLALRFDFADTYGSGLEALSAMSATNNTLTNMGLAETMAVTLYYIDCYGEEHAANVPAVLNAAEFTKGLLSANDAKKAIGGFAQQGEGMALGIFLPDYVSLVPDKGVTVTLGAEEAKKALGVTATASGAAGQLRKNRISLSEKDAASFVTMAVYDLSSAQVSASVENDTIRYRYTGDPIYYQPVEFVSGNTLRVGANTISLTKYEHGKLLAPRDKTERYLLELTTDAVTGAGTKDDIMMSINWMDLEGNAKMSDALNVRELSRDFNGWWYGSVEQDIAYYQGVASGKTLRFFVPLQNVKKITDIKVWMNASGGHDDWQMKDLTISTVDSFDKRVVKWTSVSADGVTSSLYFDRTVQGTVVYRFTDTAVNPVLIQQSAEDLTDVGPSREDNLIGGGGSGSIDVTSTKKVDWSKLRYSMTFQEASQELALGKERYLYAVTVHVAGNAEATLEDGDCGSRNLFYFGLIFKNGRSGLVLANQQLPSDGFIAGSSQTFYISTNDDYGDVTAVQIIPEDSSEDGDLFDKLNIASIDVKRESNSALVPVWTVSQVGWISIDYRDKAQMQSVTGMTGRSASEVARTYTVDGSTFDVNFMLAITTQGYPEGAPQLRANLSAVVKYDSYNPSRGRDEISDVTKSMYAYMNHAATTSDDVGGRTISDPNLMFRADHTDRFYFSLSDVRSIKSIDLQVISAVSTTWKISDVSLFMVNGEGSLILNSKGEYQRVYRAGEELTELAHGTSNNSPAYSKVFEPYDGTKNSNGELMNGGPGEISISFTENEIEINPDAAQWKSIVTREPVSENDTLNVFLYPEAGKTDPVNGLIATIQYSTAQDKDRQTTTGVMSSAIYNGQEVYYATNINASRLTALNSVTIYGAGGGSGIRGGSVRAVIQRVRSGVVINTWDLGGSGYTDPAGILLGTRATDTTERQRVLLQLGTATETALLSEITDNATSEYNNLAVAIYYRADDPSSMELRSPYVYLSDQGYTQLRPGQVIELNFNQLNIAEITGIALISTGDVSAVVDGALVVDEMVGIKTGDVISTKGTYSSAEPLTVSNVPYRMNIDSVGEHNVKLLSLTFGTALSATDDVSAGTKGPVRMSLGYYDAYGDLIQRTYPDIRPYISDGSAGFSAGSKVRVEMLVPDVYDLRWIELEPYSETMGAETQRAMWTLDSLTADLADGEVEKHSEVKQQIVEGEPLRLSLADILIAADVYITGDGDEKEELQTVTSGDAPLLAESGETLRIVPRIVGSYDAFTATLVEVEATSGALGRPKLNDTRGYTEESIAAKAEAATDSREAAIWNATKPQTGSFEFDTKEIRFLPPRNYTGAPMQYQIRITSAESASSELVINVTVKSESNPVTEQLDELARTIEAEREAETQRRLEALESANSEDSDLGGGGTDAGDAGMEGTGAESSGGTGE